MKKNKCEDCGTEKNVTETLCPYEEEISGKKIKVKLCTNCYDNRCNEI